MLLYKEDGIDPQSQLHTDNSTNWATVAPGEYLSRIKLRNFSPVWALMCVETLCSLAKPLVYPSKDTTWAQSRQRHQRFGWVEVALFCFPSDLTSHTYFYHLKGKKTHTQRTVYVDAHQIGVRINCVSLDFSCNFPMVWSEPGVTIWLLSITQIGSRRFIVDIFLEDFGPLTVHFINSPADHSVPIFWRFLLVG